MASISKNIYNCSIFCHQIYDLYYHFIYTELLDYCKDFISKSQTEKLKNDPVILVNALQNELLNICNKKHKHYSENFRTIGNTFKDIYFAIKMHNKLTPIINNNYNTTKRTIMNWLSKYVKCLEIEHHMYEKKIIDTINMFYMKNFNSTKDEILNHVPCTIGDKSFIDDVKNNKCIVQPFLRFDTKLAIQKYIENTLKINKNKEIIKYLNSDQYIIKCFTYKNLGENLDKLPPDVILNIIDKSHANYVSFYRLRQNGFKCNKPDFLPKEAKFNLFYTASSRKQITINKIDYVRINLGKYVSKNYAQISKSETHLKDTKTKELKYTKYINLIGNNSKTFFGQYMFIKLPTKLKNKKIGLINIAPIYDGFKYKVCYSYDVDKVEIEDYDKLDLRNYVFGDLGMANLVTFYDPTGDKQNIISGKQIGSINKYYNKMVDVKKSELDEIGTGTKNEIMRALIRRESRIDGLFNEICKWISETYEDKKCVVLGYNKNWKSGINLGKKTNRLFYGIPFMKLINKLKLKLNKEGRELKMTEESYTSKCDALGLEEIGKHENYMGERKRRGLYKSSIGKIINADMNGAINIGRKYMKKIGGEMKKINQKGIYNPKKIKKL